MILAAALCAEGKGPPPIELEYAWQSNNGMLPNKGGLRDQPYALIKRMYACFNVWQAMNDYMKHDMDTKWVKSNPDKWRIVVGILDLYSLLERGEISKPIRPIYEIDSILARSRNVE